ncbi:MAG: hypothetical protein ACREHG_05015, partial [Candidatus Saccharimonadales bacterium]
MAWPIVRARYLALRYEREIELQLETDLCVLKDIMPSEGWAQFAREYTRAVLSQRPVDSSTPLVMGDEVTSAALAEADEAAERDKSNL